MVYRIRQLLQVPAEVRFLSCEPLIGPLEFDPVGIDWVIVGGESGLHRRPVDPEWVRAIRDRCTAAGVAFFFKQWGGRTPKAWGRDLDGRSGARCRWGQWRVPDSPEALVDGGFYLPEIGAHSLEKIRRHNYHAALFSKAMAGKWKHRVHI